MRVNQVLANKLKIVAVSDVTLGFGSTQIPAFIKYLTSLYNGDAVVIEPDQTDMPVRPQLNGKNMIVHKVTTSDYIYGRTGRIEYITKASKLINKLKPDILVIFVTFSLPVLFKIENRPKLVIYYALETVSAYGELDVQMNSQIGSKVDLIIFPEENRAAKFAETCKPKSIPIVIALNCTNAAETNTIPSSDRNGKIIHQGRLREDTGVDYYLEKRLQEFPIDLFGVIDIEKKNDFMHRLIRMNGNVSYKGVLAQDAIAMVRKQYAFSIVFWKPTNENNRFACPNKFFESIADGVPPISAPIPQCTTLIKRYKCGLLMRDWTFDSFYDSLEAALNLYGTEEYHTMVDNCRKAVEAELNWPAQMQKVRKFLPNL